MNGSRGLFVQERFKPFGLTVEEAADAIGQGIETKIRDAEQPLGSPEQMPDQNL